MYIEIKQYRKINIQVLVKYNNMKQEIELLEDSKKVVFRLTPERIEKLKIIAARKRQTQNDLFNEAMDDFFKKYEKLWK